jgi:DNA-binding protein HU-beta
MKKTDFVKAVYDNGGFNSKVEATHAVDAVFDTIVETLAKGDSVKITGFGTFDTKNVKEKTGKVPGKSESYTSPAHVSPTFGYSKTVKDTVREIKKA